MARRTYASAGRINLRPPAEKSLTLIERPKVIAETVPIAEARKATGRLPPTWRKVSDASRSRGLNAKPVRRASRWPRDAS